MMKRRGFLRFLGLVPTAVLVPKPAAEAGGFEVVFVDPNVVEWTPIGEVAQWDLVSTPIFLDDTCRGLKIAVQREIERRKT